MAGLEDLFSGFKGGYEQAGGVTPSNLFTGAEQNPADIPQNVAGGAGGLLGSIFGKATDLAVRTVPEIIKNPASFLNDQGELSITRVLFPDFRRQKEQEDKQAAEQQKAELTARALTQGNELLKTMAGIDTPEARQAALGAYGSAGSDPRLAAAAQSATMNQAAVQSAAQGIGVPAPIAPYVSAGSLSGLYQSAERNKAMQAKASAGKERAKTTGEKALEAYYAAESSGDPLAMAVAEAELMKVGKSSAPMTVVSPDGQVVTGPASEVQGFETGTRRDAALASVDSNRAFLDAIGDVRKIANENPEAFGVAGATQALIQNTLAQAPAIVALKDRVLGDMSQPGNAADSVRDQVLGAFVPEIPAVQTLIVTLAAAKARANNPVGQISDSDFQNALREVTAGGGMLTNAESTKAVLDVLERTANRNIERANSRAGKGGKPNALAAALAARRAQAAGVQPSAEQPKKKRKLGKKPEGDYMDGMPDFSKMSDEELRALSGQ